MASSSKESNSVIEGFICPICLQDQQTFHQLQDHFESAHAAEKDIPVSLRGLLVKAKRKILKQDSSITDQEDDISQTDKKSPKLFFPNWGPYEPGKCRRHTQYFLQTRNTRMENYTTETNKLIVRLDKLLMVTDLDPDKRKAHERDVVDWIKDNDVKLCPYCTNPFTFSRRRHHCRLCGAVLCQTCSHFVDHNFAKKLAQPSLTPESSKPVPNPSPRRESSSLMSLVPFSSTQMENHIRICCDCLRLLERKARIMDQKNPETGILEHYKKMKIRMKEVESLIQTYEKINESIRLGEHTFSLKEGKNLREQITRAAENIDLLSRKMIIAWGPKEGEETQQAKVLKNIRQAVSIFLRENVLTLAPLPTAAELAQLTDPMLQQIKNIRIYIEQARNENKTDEVAMLENNLRELEAEYNRQQKQKRKNNPS